MVAAQNGSLLRRNNVRIFIYCADPSEEADLERKISALLAEPEEKIIRISVFGGPIALAYPEALKSTCSVLLGQIRFAVKKFPVDEIVLVGHNCGFYSEIRERRPNKKADLARASENIARYFRCVKVTAVFEETKDGETTFSPVFCSEALSLVTR
jgi:hypothetical protein